MKKRYRKTWPRRLAGGVGVVMSALLMLAALGVLAAVVPVFGNRGLIVRSGSMEPAVGVGDLVVVRPRADEYRTGDVIAFRSGGQDKVIVTHRIIGLEQVEGGPVFTTQGDANDQPDVNKVKPEHIIGRQILTVPYLGQLLAFGKTRGGYVAFILVPGLLVILSEAAVIVREAARGRRRPALVARPAAASAAHARGALAGKRQAPVLTEKRQVLARRVAIPIDSVTRGPIVNLVRTVTAAAVVAIMLPSTFAFYSDSEASIGNVFQAGCWTPPAVPVHVYPPDGTVASAGSHWVTNPYLDWEDAAAPCGGVVKYQYQSARNPGFAPVAYTSGLLSASQIPAPGTPDGVYWWHVRSYDGQNYSDWSSPWQLTVDRSLGAADHVVISEVQIAGTGGTNQDFIELYNPTDDSINMDGWRLVKRSNTGGESDVNVINTSPNIPAHGFWLWANTSLSALGPDEATAADLSSDNSVQLRKADGTPVDAVAWGNGTNQYVEGSAWATNPAAGQSLERKAVSDSTTADMGTGGVDEERGNGFDSDDNSFDFILRPVSNPQNSGSAPESL